MLAEIYTKTDKGREEIAHRSQNLPNRMRTLLLLIDGKHTSESVLTQVTSLGLNASHLRELLEQGFIQECVSNVASPIQHTLITEPSTKVDTLSDQQISSSPSNDSNKYQQLYHLYTDLIKANLGLRGFTLQLKVEKSSSVEDFLNLRTVLVSALAKSSGRDVASLAHDKICKIVGIHIPEDF